MNTFLNAVEFKQSLKYEPLKFLDENIKTNKLIFKLAVRIKKLILIDFK